MEEQQIAEQLLAHNRQEIDRADGKAVHGLAVAGTAAAAVVGFVLGGSWSPRELGPVQTGFWWIGAALWILGAVCLLLAIYPRVSGEPDRSRLAYFGHVDAMDDAQLTEALRHAAAQPLTGVVSELRWTSRIVLIKYRFIQLGLACLCLSLLSLAAQAI
ncbi:Pycsar system effector family protein [Actinoplanes xinjiangensis]|jgi:hypothetical protein|uniref:Pycsar effector protein domain-containing protein n=1 Tax=Actinoplanes xinjiangensis TaxID=512350 RepID=A0A316EXT4_9ACTN|nr:Pycsar system effector family protein [Actinoplanes xinjiangensis]PWK35894.1 hypothetical protein BC793_12595 [Actinoplanes xinjiangensis]GIF43077.1 hypothetical protein Axi01nite_73880 [Actinoplanes xinjiangensis]